MTILSVVVFYVLVGMFWSGIIAIGFSVLIGLFKLVSAVTVKRCPACENGRLIYDEGWGRLQCDVCPHHE